MNSIQRKVRSLIRCTALASMAIALWACKQQKSASSRTSDEAVESLVAEEEWMASMSSHLGILAEQIETLPFSCRDAPSFFAENLELAPEPDPDVQASHLEHPSGIRIRQIHHPPTDTSTSARSRAVLWRSSAADFAGTTLTRRHFAFVDGSFLDFTRRTFRAELAFAATTHHRNGSTTYLETKQEVDWQLTGGSAPPSAANEHLVIPDDWRVTRWRPREVTVTTSRGALFEDVTAQAIPDPKDLAGAVESKHVDHLHTLFQGGEIPLKKEYGKYFTTDATSQHPCLAVVDVDRDGWDDLFVGVRWGRNLLLRNRGDGTFEERGRELGLGLEEGLTAAAIFADFDNDGDEDAFLGRTLERSRYLVNEGGTYLDRSETLQAGPLPYLTTSVAAADFNKDGLLDLYLCTYGFASTRPRDMVARDFLSDYPPDLISMHFLSPANEHPYADLPGPPNVLLVNQGEGQFKVSEFSAQVASWRESLQATWADFDRDGDPDLYVCNDFAPDQLYRNDGIEGFVEVTSELGDDRMLGFGMGASFGDYDNDLDLDLYVSNMFSKAGLRITSKAGTRDERLRWSAEGNRLFVNHEGRQYRSASEGMGKPIVVAKAGWSWGGQFVDFDNDSHLDLYVPNGYFTAPKAYAGKEDL